MKILHQRKSNAEDRVNSIRDALSDSQDVPDAPNLCVYITGSYGRLEASQYSDLDLFFIHLGSEKDDSISNVDKTLIDANVIKICRKLEFPEFTKGGIYLKIHYLDDILDKLGSPEDDAQNFFTARMLLLLESLPITNTSIYEQSIRKVIDSYYRDYNDHEKDFHPVFLVNDIHRYWRTMCLNYEHNRERSVDSSDDKKAKAHLKNLKLKFSRLQTCFSMIAPILAVKGSVSPDQIYNLVTMTPQERLNHIVTVKPSLKTCVDGILTEYGWFLEKTGVDSTESLKWILDRGNRNLAFDRARNFGKLMYNLIQDAPDDPERLRFLVL